MSAVRLRYCTPTRVRQRRGDPMGRRIDPMGPYRYLGEVLRGATDPARQPGPVRRLADMSPEEQARMRALYERPAPKG